MKNTSRKLTDSQKNYQWILLRKIKAEGAIQSGVKTCKCGILFVGKNFTTCTFCRSESK